MPALQAAEPPVSVAPDLILKNGRIRSDLDSGPGWAQAMSIRDGSILTIGTNKAIEAEKGPGTKTLDLGGRVALAGFNDSYVRSLEIEPEQLSQLGITSIQGGPVRGEEDLKMLREASDTGRLRVRYAIWGDFEKPQEFLALREKYKTLSEEWVRFEALTADLDGDTLQRTAALALPYSDSSGASGAPRYTQEHLNELVLTANRLGLPVVLHAGGDRAVTMAMVALTQAHRQLFNSRLRNRVDSIEVAPAFAFARMAEGNLVAGMQPGRLIPASEAKSLDSRLGPQRARNAYACKSMLASRVHLAFGSGWPAMPLNPMIGLFAAVFRAQFNGRPSGGWQPSQKITLDQAIDAYTLGSAYATREEHVKGSLREGKYADVVILEKDPFRQKGPDLPRVPVYMTIVAGRIVYDGSLAQIKAAN